MNPLQIRRALFTVSDKTGIAELARALARTGTEIVATGKTAQVLEDGGIAVVPIEKISGSPEAFNGRMKTLSFPVSGGILYRRGDANDEADRERLKIPAIDCVVVNFYPFEEAAKKLGTSTAASDRAALIEQVDIGGPTLVRAAAKNAPDVLVLTDPRQYGQVIAELEASGKVSAATALATAARAWDRVHEYDRAIAYELGESPRLKLRYGENPHQSGELEIDPEGPIAWPTGPSEALTPAELSYNNILDLSAAYALACDLVEMDPAAQGVVIVKHNNPCGVALTRGSQQEALELAWAGDPVSAFGGVLVFTRPLEAETARWLSERFVELVAAPELAAGNPGGTSPLSLVLGRRKNLKAVCIRRFGEVPAETVVQVPGGRLRQSTDRGLGDPLRSVTRQVFPADKQALGRFGIAVCRALKSNSIAIVREIPGSGSATGARMLVGAGQGQPNRIEALEMLAVPRARGVLAAAASGAGASGDVLQALGECVMVSDAFFPFRDTIDACAAAGLRYVIQPGGSIKDAESVAACDEQGISMAFTGVRHFRH